MNTATLLLMLIPMFLTPWVLRLCWPHKISWVEMSVSFVIASLVTSVVYVSGIYGKTSDVEIINGEVVGKDREHGTYLESYSCRCRTVRSGKTTSTKCDTCYRRHYTVDWTCQTNIGSFTIDSEDSRSSAVYNLPDPSRYTQIQKGDPVSKTHHYVNYVKGAPDSLFHHINTKKHKKLIPPYPERIYDIYKIDRVLDVGVGVPDIKTWNQDISHLLKKLGPQKQANVIIVFVNTNDQSYLHSLEGEWIGGNKNDIIVVVGSTSYPKIDWVGISSWTDSQLFKVQLRDDIMSFENIDRSKILSAIEHRTMTSFVRKNMEDFKYLEDQIEPPLWVIVLAAILGIGSIVGTSWFFYHNDPFKI